ncbi:MAG: hypothetical protein FD179_979 [Erysipelotrichaceae bacterium]|nr:MAG: hypothetical protein FD179_979 [Erysipelotrichaceae bacterium]
MEINEKIYLLSERVKQLVPQIKTEEATKQSLILPFFQILGYDVFNPLEFCPEFIADVGIKKGEKVDYTILIDGKPLILVEAKACSQKLEKHDSQLFRYFSTTESKFAILTNGVIYRFYTDLDIPNKMDAQPFFEFNLNDVSEQSIDYLENFMKHKFSIENILTSASELKYLNLVKVEFKNIVENPSDEFLKLIVSKIYDGTKTQVILEKFKPIVKKGINQFINEKMSAKFKETLNNSENTEIPTAQEEIIEESKINTTFDELSAYAIVKSILRPYVKATRVLHKDTESYFGVILDNNIRKWICRFEFGKKLYLHIPDNDKKTIRIQIENLDNIYDYSEQLIESLKRYL